MQRKAHENSPQEVSACCRIGVRADSIISEDDLSKSDGVQSAPPDLFSHQRNATEEESRERGLMQAAAAMLLQSNGGRVPIACLAASHLALASPSFPLLPLYHLWRMVGKKG